MTVFSVSRATKVLALAVVLAASGMMATASAGDNGFHRYREHHGRHFARVKRLDGGSYGSRVGAVLRYRGGDDRSFSYRQAPDTFSGSIVAYQDTTGSVYIYGDGRREPWYQPLPKKSGAKVVTITPDYNDCVYEMNVCVMR